MGSPKGAGPPSPKGTSIVKLGNLSDLGVLLRAPGMEGSLRVLREGSSRGPKGGGMKGGMRADVRPSMKSWKNFAVIFRLDQ